MAVAKPTEPPKTRMTEPEFLRLPDDGHKYELVDGEPKTVPTSFEHDIFGGNLLFLLKLANHGRGYFTAGQSGFRMRSGNIRCPDVSFTLKSRLPDGKPNKGFGDQAPNLCIEIISSTEERAEIERKLAEYFDSGAQRVWHLYPDTQTVGVFTAPEESYKLTADDTLDAGDMLPEFRCRVGDLFVLE